MVEVNLDSEKFEQREEKVRNLLKKGEISLLLDSYTGIFSDFDPRPYAERTLSDDFLLETKKAARDKTGNLELKFLIPSRLRKFSAETIIKKRLHKHFKKHHALLAQEEKDTMKKGVIITSIGFITMVIATFLYDSTIFLLKFIRVILEPAGWFAVWYGLDHLFYLRNQHKPELEFYQKMSKAKISFMSY